MFKRIMIANRGGAAMRVLRCCREMGIETVVAHSEADRESLPVQFSEMNVCIGPARASESYLNQESIIQAAKSLGCEAIHPGWGFLSENADFAQKCAENGITFIGPLPETIRMLGDKQAARKLMEKNGVSTVPGSDGVVGDLKEARDIAEKIGYPVLIKAVLGGGGRGIRAVESPQQLAEAFESAGAEALGAFGDGRLYIEKLIRDPRHIEVQIIGDRYGNVVVLGDRDCSLQRRRQKAIEEAPANVPDAIRSGLWDAAARAARASGYYGAGTAEFITDRDGRFYFIEMNTRLQVEHSVTEDVCGIDIVREQMRVAAGLPLDFCQDDVNITGHAIECRINAENPAQGFKPCPGRVSFLHFPGGIGVRVESAMYSGIEVMPYYDSMIARIIVSAPSRLRAIRKMRMALSETTIEGVSTNVDFLYLLMHNFDYIRGDFDTSFLDRNTEAILGWDGTK